MSEKLRVYAQWVGNPWGVPEDTMRCIEGIHDSNPRLPIYYQCRRKRGFGKGGLYCKQHAKKHPEDDDE